MTACSVTHSTRHTACCVWTLSLTQPTCVDAPTGFYRDAKPHLYMDTTPRLQCEAGLLRVPPQPQAQPGSWNQIETEGPVRPALLTTDRTAAQKILVRGPIQGSEVPLLWEDTVPQVSINTGKEGFVAGDS